VSLLRTRGKLHLAFLAELLMLWGVPGPAGAQNTTSTIASPPAQTNVGEAKVSVTFVRVFSSPDDVRALHPILDQTLDILAGPADPAHRAEGLQTPSAVATDSGHRVFVSDLSADAVHVFDFVHSKYARWGGRGDRMHAPISLSVDRHDNLYVVDQSTRTVLVYDSAGKFRRYLGKLKGGESYFGSPAGIAVDRGTGRIYVCDRQAQMIFVMDERGKLIRRIGTRGGGEGPGEFRFPSQVVVAGDELFGLDSGNSRIQVFDKAGTFVRAIHLARADRHAGLAADNQGNIYLSDPSLNQIQVFRHDGQLVYTFDPSTVKGASFGHPSGMWIDAGRTLYVVDSQGSRVGVLQIETGTGMR
jgi:DNA-binding beta-propeller fold protein YncE